MAFLGGLLIVWDNALYYWRVAEIFWLSNNNFGSIQQDVKASVGDSGLLAIPRSFPSWIIIAIENPSQNRLLTYESEEFWREIMEKQWKNWLTYTKEQIDMALNRR